ncbi:MAG: nifQ family protein [Rhodocyclales bacterium]|nr:nifQ family protein [Rhodocyclales bacterium]
MPSVSQNPSQNSVRPSSHPSVRTRSGADFQPLGNSSRTAESSVHKALMALASRPRYGVTLALAGTIAHSWQTRGMRYLPLFGMDVETSYRLLSTHFPGIDRIMGAAWGELVQPDVFEEAFALADLVEMLDHHRTVVDEDSTWLAHAVATSCLGSDELWRDMNLPSAIVLRDLLHDFFTILAVRNRSDMPWKKFFQNELAERAERRLRRAAGCGSVADYASCFGR